MPPTPQLPVGRYVHKLHPAVGPPPETRGRIRKRVEARSILECVRGKAALGVRGYHEVPAGSQGEDVC